MKAQEVLNILHITRPTLTKYVKQGLIKTDSKINGQYIYNDESVIALAHNNTHNNTQCNNEYAEYIGANGSSTIVDDKTNNKLSINGIDFDNLVNAVMDMQVLFKKLLPILAQLRVIDAEYIKTYNDLVENVTKIAATKNC